MVEVFAFNPSNLGDGVEINHLTTMYDTDLPNQYAVENADEKMDRAIENLPKPPEEHDLEPGDHWVRYDFQSLVDDDRDPKRVGRGYDG